MGLSAVPRFTKRYRSVTEDKAGGATYTPAVLADFVAQQIIQAAAKHIKLGKPLRILDPAVGDGELLVSLVRTLGPIQDVHIHAFDVRSESLAIAKQRLLQLDKSIQITTHHGDFLHYVTEKFAAPSLFSSRGPSELFDLIIANPPYVRTQIMGAESAQALAQQFGLTGRVDLYYAFLIALSRVLSPQGFAGIIVSNRFMTTRAGASVRAAVQQAFNLRHVWDLGDTKLFNAAVLPAVILLEGRHDATKSDPIGFTSIYETSLEHHHFSDDPISALAFEGTVRVADDRRFEVRHGQLSSSGTEVWKLSNHNGDAWLQTVQQRTWRVFGGVGKIRVGVKTCADTVFIRSDWNKLDKIPELLRPLTTHHIARRFRAQPTNAQILYPHQMLQGIRQAVSLDNYPFARGYLEAHKHNLESRRYVIEAGRNWYEIWVPQNPDAWQKRKLVFRDISEKPVFWIDEQGTVVNGDCYWMVANNDEDTELLWLACAVANSTFIESFYDRNFNNKLYAGRRRFITQYVEQFPLPNPESELGRKITANAKAIYATIGSLEAEKLQVQTDALVWEAFGLGQKEISG